MKRILLLFLVGILTTNLMFAQSLTLATRNTTLCPGGSIDLNSLITTNGSLITWSVNPQATAIAAGAYHNVALFSNGTINVWGANTVSQLNIPNASTMPMPVAITAAGNHTFVSLSNNNIVAWGDNPFGELNIPNFASIPSSVVAGGDHGLALLSNGTVSAWGSNVHGQSTVPSFTATPTLVAAGRYHSLALLSNGTVKGWGRNDNGQTTSPSFAASPISLTAGEYHSLALLNNGAVVGWGDNSFGQTTIPSFSATPKSISGGGAHNLALLSNGIVRAWGLNNYGQTTVPGFTSPPIAVSAGYEHSLVLMADGSIIGWGDSRYGQTVGYDAQALNNSTVSPSSTTTYYVVVRDAQGNKVTGQVTVFVCQNITWTGSTSSDWATPTNWLPNGVPTSIDNAIIPTTTNKPTLPSNQTVATLSLTGNNKVILGSNSLTVNTLTGGNAGTYIVTNGFGSLIIKNIPTATPTLFPIGASLTSYDPLSIKPINSVDFAAKVKITPTATDFTGSINNFSKVVPRQWDITPTGAAGSTVLTLTNGGTAYTPTNPKVGHYSTTPTIAWEELPATYATNVWTTTTTTFSPFGVGDLTGFVGVIPIELLEFKADPSVSGNILTWTTASEINNKGFQVERLQATGNWEILGFVAAKGKAASYQFIDNEPFSTSYYRLRQLDNDGKETFSKVVSVFLKSNNKLKAYPNPVSTILTIETDATGEYQIMNFLGQEVSHGKIAKNINISVLPQGAYFLKVGEETVKFIKQ